MYAYNTYVCGPFRWLHLIYNYIGIISGNYESVQLLYSQFHMLMSVPLCTYEVRETSQSAVMCLQSEARSHYNCSIASGLELEYEGGGGSRFSHWEMRLVEVISVHA